MNIELKPGNIILTDFDNLYNNAGAWYDKLVYRAMDYPGSEYTGWVELPSTFDPEVLEDIKATADEIRKECSLFIVVGVGGSFLGAKAVIDMLERSGHDGPEIVFTGNTISPIYHNRILNRFDDPSEDINICVISKSGSTMEPLIAYSILKEKMFEKYGEEEAYRRITVITDKSRGILKPEADEHGMKAFVVPDDIGGRYSVLSPVGLLPIAVAGFDVEMLLKGAAEMTDKAAVASYAAWRVGMQHAGKDVEVFEHYEPDMNYFGEWLIQLFGESEGKAGRGALPVSLCFSRDLHSIGQYLQQGHQMFWETVISMTETPEWDVVIPASAGEQYAGMTMNEINKCAEEGVIKAHAEAGIPICRISVQRIDEYWLGQLIYFFEMAAALSGYLIGINPFDQPGVEAYKSEMRKLIASDHK